MKKIFKLLLIFSLLAILFGASQALAADMYSIQDQLSRLKIGTPSQHKIKFKVNEDLLEGYSIEIDFFSFQIRSSGTSLDQNVVFLVEPYTGTSGRGFYNDRRTLALDIANGDQISIIDNKILKIVLSDGGGNSALIPKNSGIEIDIGVLDPFILNAVNPGMVKTDIYIYNRIRSLITKGSVANVMLVSDQVGLGGQTEKEIKKVEVVVPEKKTLIENVLTVISRTLELVSGIFRNITAGFDILAKTIVNTPLIKENKTEISSIVVATAAASLILPLVFNFELLAPFSKLIAYLVFFSQKLRKKIKPWGMVYNSETHAPVPLAEVTLIESEFNKKIATQLTDANGRFSFLAPPGEYYIKILQENFIFPSKFIPTEYHGELIEVKKEATISLSIPLDPKLSVLTQRLIILDRFSRTVQAIKYPLLVIGTLVTASFYYLTKNFTDLFLLISYIFLWAFELSQLFSPRSFGKVLDEFSKKPLGQCIIRFFNRQNKLIATKVTNDKGHFSALINPGQFNLQVTKSNYKFFKEKLEVKKEGLLIKDIKLASLSS